VKKKANFIYKFFSKRRIISLMHSSILRRIWLNFMVLCSVFRISDFQLFYASITEAIWFIEMRIWCIKIGIVLVQHIEKQSWRCDPVYHTIMSRDNGGIICWSGYPLVRCLHLFDCTQNNSQNVHIHIHINNDNCKYLQPHDMNV
jgi:hypothetical protein